MAIKFWSCAAKKSFLSIGALCAGGSIMSRPIRTNDTKATAVTTGQLIAKSLWWSCL
jgi:hypothetical protein